MTSATATRAARVDQRRAKIAARVAAADERRAAAKQRQEQVEQRRASAHERRLAADQRVAVAQERREAREQRLAIAAAAAAAAQHDPIVQEKSWLARSRAWISILLLVPIAILVVLAPPHFVPESAAGIVCSLAGYLLFAGGVAWRWWATVYIGGAKDREVITQGAYSVCRNPLYLGTLLIALSAACFMQSLSLAVMIAVVSLYYLGVTIANEEERLALRMGQPYLAYKARVPRLWPRLSLYESKETVTVEIGGLKAEAIRALRYGWLPLACQGLMLVRDNAWWPVVFPLP